MYVNSKMVPAKTISGIGGGRWIKESGGGDEFKYDIFDTLYEPLLIPPSTTIKENKQTKQNKTKQSKPHRSREYNNRYQSLREMWKKGDGERMTKGYRVAVG
jgi:hypothetical protein